MHRGQQILLRLRQDRIRADLRPHVEIVGTGGGYGDDCGTGERQPGWQQRRRGPHWRTPEYGGPTSRRYAGAALNQTVISMTTTVNADRANPNGTTDVQASRL